MLSEPICTESFLMISPIDFIVVNYYRNSVYGLTFFISIEESLKYNIVIDLRYRSSQFVMFDEE